MGVPPMCTTGVPPVFFFLFFLPLLPLLPLSEETKREEAATARMAVVHTGKMPVLQGNRLSHTFSGYPRQRSAGALGRECGRSSG
jgi:hypothetical protein